MTYFKLIADMLHLASFIILLLKIRNSRNCIGKSWPTTHRTFGKNTRAFCDSFQFKIPGSLSLLYILVQHDHENLLYFSQSLYSLPH